MTPVQTLTIKLSEMRTRLNVLAALETLEEKEKKRDRRICAVKFGAAESQLRAAITAEGERPSRNRALGQFEGEGGGEGAEKKKLLARKREWLITSRPAAGGVGISGRAAELNAALEVSA